MYYGRQKKLIPAHNNDVFMPGVTDYSNPLVLPDVCSRIDGAGNSMINEEEGDAAGTNVSSCLVQTGEKENSSIIVLDSDDEDGRSAEDNQLTPSNGSNNFRTRLRYDVRDRPKQAVLVEQGGGDNQIVPYGQGDATLPTPRGHPSHLAVSAAAMVPTAAETPARSLNMYYCRQNKLTPARNNDASTPGITNYSNAFELPDVQSRIDAARYGSVTNVSSCLVQTDGKENSSIIVLDSDDEDGTAEVRPWLRYNVRDRPKRAMPVGQGGGGNQIVPYGQGDATALNRFSSQTSSQPSVQFQKVVLQEVPQEERVQDLASIEEDGNSSSPNAKRVRIDADHL